jgi:very-short-patch-repair endonuclease
MAISAGMMSKTTSEHRRSSGRAGGPIGRRGKTESLAKKIKRAKTVEATGGQLSNPTEAEIAARFTAAGVTFRRQTAIGPYLGDFAVGSVIVEIVRQKTCKSVCAGTFAARTNYILNAGWHMLFVWLAQHPIPTDMAQNIIAHLEAIGADPSGARKYRVIGRTGQLLAAGRADDDEIAFVWPATRRNDLTARNHDTVAR